MMGLATGRMGVGLIGDLELGPVLALGLAGAGHALIGRSAAGPEREESVHGMLPDVPVLTGVNSFSSPSTGTTSTTRCRD
jgi:hypothetical protein